MTPLLLAGAAYTGALGERRLLRVPHAVFPVPGGELLGWSAVVGVRQVDGHGELLKATGLDELLLLQCPGGERE